MCFLLICNYSIYTYVILYSSVFINDFIRPDASENETDLLIFSLRTIMFEKILI